MNVSELNNCLQPPDRETLIIMLAALDGSPCADLVAFRVRLLGQPDDAVRKAWRETVETMALAE